MRRGRTPRSRSSHACRAQLASGLSAPDRLQDFADVIALIRVNALGQDYAAALSDYVRDKYAELWNAAQTKSEP